MERILSVRRKSSDATGSLDTKGLLGMNMLYSPSEPLIDYIFVHGLGGGSTKTWCLGDDPNNFWPRIWLPMEPSFRNVRIHSFGYNADWTEKKESSMNIHDFGCSLLEAIRSSPSLKASGNNPIVCVGHSMGGLVIKQAYVLARQDPTCADLANRIKAMIFLATPHRGSDLASTLNSMLRVSTSHSARPYISNLERTSDVLAILNNTFRHYTSDLTLVSFYETQPTSLGPRSVMIVQKDSAQVGCAGERVAPLNANHRGVCKFGTPTDMQARTEDQLHKDILRIDQYLGEPGKPEDDLRDLEEARIEGSCEWFAERAAFQKWVDLETLPSSQLYWVSAKPATGKSVLSAYIINTLNNLNLDCTYYFFRYGTKERSTASGLLLSLAFQMALFNASVRGKLLTMIDKGIRFDKKDAKAVWRKVFLPTVFKAEWCRTQYWVIDALDECSDFGAVFPMLASIEPSIQIRVLFTSRRTGEIETHFAALSPPWVGEGVFFEEMNFEDTKSDMILYLEANRERLHVGDTEQRQVMTRRILEKSEGCFLWIRLVLEELAMEWSLQHAHQVLEDVPQEMDPLYRRALQIMASKPRHAQELARAILTWVICAIRPLTVPELRTALEADTGQTVEKLDMAIASLCAQLVYVDKSDRVLMVHLTARSFLVDRELESTFAVDEKPGHLRLAQSCLRCLCSQEMKPLRGRRVRKQLGQPQFGLFTSYASLAFAEHIRQTTSKDLSLAKALNTFLESNVFSWIECIASTRNLSVLTQTSNSLKHHLQRRLKHTSPLDRAIQFAESWVVDLQRMPTKFGDTLITSPSAIHSLIPPFCPASSAIRLGSMSSSKGLKIHGLRDDGWDDRLACINKGDNQIVSVACGESIFAIGLQRGQISLYHNTTCQEWKSLDHQSVLRYMQFDSSGSMLASSGRRNIRVWNVENGLMLWNFDIGQEILALVFCDSEKALVAVTKANSVLSWYLQTGQERDDRRWDDAVDFGDEGQFRRPPVTAAFCPDESLLAIVYRGRPICLWDMEDRSLHGFVGREKDPGSLALGTNTSPASVVFNANQELTLLAAAYEDGDLCLFDYDELRLIDSIEANAQILACSGDGLTLASGNSAGMVQLLSFETLQLLYRINTSDYSIRCIAFSADNLRFLDVRGTQCNVWEPAVLSGLVEKKDSSTEGEPLKPKIIGMSDGELEIVTIELDNTGDFFFVGKSDGSVCVYAVKDGLERRILYRHTYGIPVTSMLWGHSEMVIATADAASRFIVYRLKADNSTGWVALEKLMDHRIESAIQEVLLSPSNERLMVCTTQYISLWVVGAKTESTRQERLTREPFRWLNHPIKPDHYIIVTAKSISIIQWDSLAPTKTIDIPPYNERSAISQRVVKNTILFCRGDTVAVDFSESHGERSTTAISILAINALDGDTAVLDDATGYEGISREVLHLIGGFESKLLFLSRRLWVCSIDLKQRDAQTMYTRHFPLPSDWRAQQENYCTKVTIRGDILYTKREEVAVIQNGLESKELVSIA
ncbi:MAG: hypothetical protein Q9198_001222 [Flavoplaca austrocitrina]